MEENINPYPMWSDLKVGDVVYELKGVCKPYCIENIEVDDSGDTKFFVALMNTYPSDKLIVEKDRHAVIQVAHHDIDECFAGDIWFTDLNEAYESYLNWEEDVRRLILDNREQFGKLEMLAKFNSIANKRTETEHAVLRELRNKFGYNG